ncbi:hypothetical protein B296_00012779 [Ensete ventricosum]|uniref:Uncharacterized protein n=1 Tax=Ensete ventricosum TaxID=4639 RepID=A0A426YTD2_ENSVE|nr:hypothetical protein B296_00012779 [Ensete ventricosum]
MSESESRWRGIVDGQVGESGGREERIRRRPGVGVCGSDGHTDRLEIAPSAGCDINGTRVQIRRGTHVSSASWRVHPYRPIGNTAWWRSSDQRRREPLPPIGWWTPQAPLVIGINKSQQEKAGARDCNRIVE